MFSFFFIVCSWGGCLQKRVDTRASWVRQKNINKDGTTTLLQARVGGSKYKKVVPSAATRRRSVDIGGAGRGARRACADSMAPATAPVRIYYRRGGWVYSD